MNHIRMKVLLLTPTSINIEKLIKRVIFSIQRERFSEGVRRIYATAINNEILSSTEEAVFYLIDSV